LQPSNIRSTAARLVFIRGAGSDFGDFLKLAVVAFEQAVKRQVLIQIRPVETEGVNFNVIQLPGCAGRQTRIIRDGKTNLRAALHANDDPAINMGSGMSSVS